MVYYQRVGQVSENYNGIPVDLALNLKFPETGNPRYAISWRTRYPASPQVNRRFYWLCGYECWTIPSTLALRLMEQVNMAGFLDCRYDDPYDRFAGQQPIFIQSDGLNPSQRAAMFQEISRPTGEPGWGHEPFFVIGEHNSASRKVMILNTEHSLVTFRSWTTDSNYRPVIVDDYRTTWRLDNTMMDVSAQIMRHFLIELQSITLG